MFLVLVQGLEEVAMRKTEASFHQDQREWMQQGVVVVGMS
jgi:hypothetical protein